MLFLSFNNKVDVDAFHKHLDSCKQCEKNPWQLCAVGQKLLGQAGQVKVATA